MYLQLNLPFVNRISAVLDNVTTIHSQPPLMGNVDPSKIDEIRRTVYVGNLNSQVNLVFFGTFAHMVLNSKHCMHSVCNPFLTDHHCWTATGVLQTGGRCKVCSNGWRWDSAHSLRLCGVYWSRVCGQSPHLQWSHVWRQTTKVYTIY